MEVERYLEDLENRLDTEDEERVLASWNTWTEHRNPEGPFRPAARRKHPSKLDWPHININDAQDDDDLALYRELEGINSQLAGGSDGILHIRTNYGVGNVASAFGCERFLMPRETDTLPNAIALGDEKAAALLGQPMPGLEAGNFAKIFRMAERFRGILAAYPKLGRYLYIDHPDMQGPMDNLELIWGSTMFYALYDEPETVHGLLKLFTDYLDRFWEKWFEILPNKNNVCVMGTHYEKGSIAVRNDSAMNLSPAFYGEFIVPYDQRLLRKYQGIVHFCGRGDHFIEQLTREEGLFGVNLSQPHLNDMQKILSATVDRGIHLSVYAPDGLDAAGHDVRNLYIYG